MVFYFGNIVFQMYNFKDVIAGKNNKNNDVGLPSYRQNIKML